jgi:hypothetical protein
MLMQRNVLSKIKIERQALFDSILGNEANARRQIDSATYGSGTSREEARQLALAVPSNPCDAHDFAPSDLEIHILQRNLPARPKDVSRRARRDDRRAARLVRNRRRFCNAARHSCIAPHHGCRKAS